MKPSRNNREIIPEVSIIVPVYNCERYLDKCICSILDQTAKNFEVLLIDDGSRDKSPDICDYYMETDKRVHCIHKENKGVSAARNTGLDMAKGEYIVFIDSDDYVDSGYIESLLAGFDSRKNQSERTYILSDYISFSESGIEHKRQPCAFAGELRPGGLSLEQFRDLVFAFRIFPPYCKLYLREIIEKYHIRFDTELRSAEDFDFNIRYLKYMDSICYVPEAHYYYRVSYKAYRPSNHGVLGRSEIKSAHIMARGIIGLAKKLGLYELMQEEINLWIARKHYFNRLPMLFAESPQVKFKDRYHLYRQLIYDKVYYRASKRGIKKVEKSTTKRIGQYCDKFVIWWLFYRLISLKRKARK